jgi:hypothetical protein
MLQLIRNKATLVYLCITRNLLVYTGYIILIRYKFKASAVYYIPSTKEEKKSVLKDFLGKNSWKMKSFTE